MCLSTVEGLETMCGQVLLHCFCFLDMVFSLLIEILLLCILRVRVRVRMCV